MTGQPLFQLQPVSLVAVLEGAPRWQDFLRPGTIEGAPGLPRGASMEILPGNPRPVARRPTAGQGGAGDKVFFLKEDKSLMKKFKKVTMEGFAAGKTIFDALIINLKDTLVYPQG